MLNIGLIGAGFMADTHVARYADMDGVSVSAVASPHSADAFVANRDIAASPYADPVSLMEDAGVDAVDICTPTPTHRELIEAAATRELDVLCEKPLANRRADLRAIRETVEDSNITCMVGHVVRFFPEYDAIHQQIRDGTIGDVGTVRARRHIPPPDWAEWYRDPEKSGGVFVDLAVHDFDYLRWVIGDVERVFARSTEWRDRQHVHAMLRFETDAIGYVEASTALPEDQSLQTQLEIAGTNGLIEYDSTDSEPLEIARGGDPGDDLGNIPPNPLAADGFTRELEAFVRAAEGETPPPVTLDDAIAAVTLSLAAKRSAEEGAPVRPAEVAP